MIEDELKTGLDECFVPLASTENLDGSGPRCPFLVNLTLNSCEVSYR
jgi:hypothetical protein